MRWRAALFRFLITLTILTILIYYISLDEITKAIFECDLRWMLVVFLLMPLFIMARISKWFILVRQITENTTLLKITPGYLWGMTLGLVTPGRLGELARVQGTKQPKKCTGLFFLEKAIEVGCLFTLCLLAIIILDFLPWWIASLLIIALIFCVMSWRKILLISIRLTGKTFGWPSQDKFEKIKWAFSNLDIRGCVLLSTVCTILFCVQIYMVLLSMGIQADPLVLPLIPLVLLTNLVPITVGGYGVRETFAVFLFNTRGIEGPVAASSVALATFFDLVIPSLVGAGIHLFYHSKEKKKHV